VKGNLVLPNSVNILTSATLPTTAIVTGAVTTGFVLGWNWSNGGGETDMLSLGQGAGDIGGFDFYATNSTLAPVAIAQFRGTSINFNFNPTLTTVPTYPQTTNTSQLATIGYVNSAVSGGASLLGTNNTWTGTNAFNTSTPTTTITQTYPQAASTTQFATIGYVNTGISDATQYAALLTYGTSARPQTFTGYNQKNLLSFNGQSCAQKITSYITTF
jgi:hypothetical protein